MTSVSFNQAPPFLNGGSLMCLMAKIDDQEFLCFYLSNGKVELRDERFHAIPLPEHSTTVLIKDSSDTNVGWREVTTSNLIRMARTKTRESLMTLKQICQQA